MSWSVRRDPVLDPALPPEAWAAARRRRRARRALGALLLVLLAALGAWAFNTLTDRTRGLAPEQVVEAAGRALLAAARYDFTAELTGTSPDGFFPATRLSGQYQADPLLLHLSGDVGSGPARTPFEYYLAEGGLFVRQVRGGGWLRATADDVAEVAAFQPDNLAAPLVVGLRGAELLGRERLGGAEAAVFALDLDPAVMRVAPAGPDEQVAYRLWVDTRSLRPLAFSILVERPAQRGSSFQYRLEWTYPESEPLALPDEVRQVAAD
ncbi:hypothetical protein [Symbiobacterium terraclitae]|uniref:hypothetical protein n=1 Tax=Symbiobacterium terraclitae TaxID=557451 RepID=UPI0035B52CA1